MPTDIWLNLTGQVGVLFAMRIDSKTHMDGCDLQNNVDWVCIATYKNQPPSNWLVSCKHHLLDIRLQKHPPTTSNQLRNSFHQLWLYNALLPVAQLPVRVWKLQKAYSAYALVIAY